MNIKHMSVACLALFLMFALACGEEDSNVSEERDDGQGNNDPASAPTETGDATGASEEDLAESEAETAELSESEVSSEQHSSQTEEDLCEAEEANFFYFSYDDSASTVGVELIKYKLKNETLPHASWARPWEFLNFESFDHAHQEKIGLFDISMGLLALKDPLRPEETIYDFGVHLSAPTLTKDDRRSAVITLIVDVSGSMDDQLLYNSEEGSVQTLLDTAKYGMTQMYESLKSGDIINLVQFSDEADLVFEGLKYEDGKETYMDKIESLHTIGSTNLNAGIELGYEVAQRNFDATKMNRVIILTDAYANTGEVDPEIISRHTEINNKEGIYFSGLGFGQNFQEAFLNQLTEAGKGGYFAIITPFDAKRAFQDRFIALLNVAAKNVRFKLDFPDVLNRRITASEESSTNETEVSTTNFSYNTSQFFFEGFVLCGDEDLSASQKTFKLTVTYKDPLTGETKTELFEKKASEVFGLDLNNVKDAHLVTLLPFLITGAISANEAEKDLSLNFANHASALATEYKKLIQLWFNVSK